MLIGLLGGIGLGYYNTEKILDKEEILANYTYGIEYKITGEVEGLYKVREYNKDYIIKLQKIAGVNIDENIDVIIKLPSNFDIRKGYVLEFSSEIKKIENFTPTFDYVRYMQTKNIYGTIWEDNIDIIEKKTLSKIDSILVPFREEFLSMIRQIYPKEEAIFLGGILIGARENLPKELSDNFNNSGLTHLIAVSGFNITIIVIFLSFLLKFFPVFLRIILITLAIVSFTMIVGDNAAVIRASVMGLIGYYIMISGREGNSFSVLLLTAFLMILYNPLSLTFDVSMHLSFLAVLGLLYTQDFFKKIFFFLPNKFAIKESFVLTLSAFAFTLPIMIFNFGQISIMSPIANLMVGGAIPFAMLFGFLSLIGYMIQPIIGVVIGFIDRLFLKYVIVMVHFFGGLEFSVYKVDIGNYGVYLEIFYFMILTFVILFRQKRKLLKSEAQKQVF